MITYTDKNIGDQFTSDDANEIKSEHNALETTVGAHDDVTLTSPAEKDLVQLESGLWVNKTTASIWEDMIFTNQWGHVKSNDYSNVTGSGSGGQQREHRRLYIFTGSTAGSTYTVRTRGDHQGYFIGTEVDRFNFGKRFQIRYILSQFGIHTTNGECHLGVGKGQSTGSSAIGDLSELGICLKMINNNAYLQVHDGTTLNTVNANTQFVSKTVYDCRILNEGDGNAHLYIDDVLKASTSAAPTALHQSGRNSFYIDVQNKADAANQAVILTQTSYHIIQ